jgi:radical SAM protein with 4Fe4S-binding SPASM domain
LVLAHTTRRSVSHGIFTAIQTGGRNLTDRKLDAAIDAGLSSLGVSIDGPPELHDRLRGVPGSYEEALSVVRRAKQRGLRISVNSQIGADTIEHLPEMMDTIIEAGATHWQIQLTVAIGNAVDNSELLLQPYRLVELMPVLARLYVEGLGRGMTILPGNNIGYFGPYEHLWRGQGRDKAHWGGCAAGQGVIGIEANGALKGCPSLATTNYTAGNVRTASAEDIWRQAELMQFGRLRSVDEMWGYCRTCYYADVCMAGCTWTSESLLGKRGNNPCCHYRVLDLARHGLRERVVKFREAPQESFACGEFALILEEIPGVTDTPSLPERDPASVHVQREAGRADLAPMAPQLELCRACNQFVWPHETACPHCGTDIAAAAQRHLEELERRRAVIDRISGVLDRIKAAPPGSPLVMDATTG